MKTLLLIVVVASSMGTSVLANDAEMMISVKLPDSKNKEINQPEVSATIVAKKPMEEISHPSLEPSAPDTSDPRRLIRYFCRLWKDEEYEKMYWAMTPKYRKAVSLKKFKDLFEADAERTGGLKDENIIVDDVDEGKEYIVTVDLRFNFIRAKDRRVKAVLEKTKNGYRVKGSGIIPLDLNDL